MSILIFEPRNRRHHLHEMYAYLVDHNKTTQDSFIGFNVNPYNPVPEMQLVQNYHHYPFWDVAYKTYQQIIFSFDNFIKEDNPFLKPICTEIGLVLLGNDQRQLFAAIHFNGTKNIHCHYMLNYIDIHGKAYRQKYKIHHYQILINEILSKYNFPLINIKIKNDIL